MMNFDAIIFDCDGVLVDSEVISIHGERKALEEMGLIYGPADYVRLFVGMHDGAFIEALKSDYREAFNADPPPDFKARIMEGRRRESHRLAIVDGADKALTQASAKRPIAVASSAGAEYLASKLSRMGLYDIAAPHVYSADLVANGKPSPDIFLHAAAQLGVAPHRCLVLEDSENGVRAGVAAGMTVCGFLGGGHIYDGHGERLLAVGAEHLVESHYEFADRFLGAL